METTLTGGLVLQYDAFLINILEVPKSPLLNHVEWRMKRH